MLCIYIECVFINLKVETKNSCGKVMSLKTTNYYDIIQYKFHHYQYEEKMHVY